MCPPHYDTILHIAVIVIFLCLGLNLFSFFFLKSYLQFYPSNKVLVIKTHAFTIIINFNSFFTNPNINWQQRDKVIQWANTFFFSFSFLFMPFFSWLRWLQSFFFLHFPLAFFCFFYFPFFSWSCFSSFFLFFFWVPCVDICVSSFFLFFFLGRRILFFLFLASFSFLFTGDLVFSLSSSIAWTSRLKQILCS